MRRADPTVLVLRLAPAARAGILAAALVLTVWTGGRVLGAIHLAFAVATLRGRVVAIDPGHGGIDPGAIGPAGVKEEAVALDVSLDLARLLWRAGAQVVLTRGPVADAVQRAGRRRIDQRSRLAQVNASTADVLVSVHANHYASPDAHGAQVFYDTDQMEESRQLALLIQAQLAAVTGETRRRASRHIGHYLLEHARMPAVTVEIGFLSNPREARLLLDPAYQRKIAYAVFLGIAYWFAERQVPGATAAPGA